MLGPLNSQAAASCVALGLLQPKLGLIVNGFDSPELFQGPVVRELLSQPAEAAQDNLDSFAILYNDDFLSTTCFSYHDLIFFSFLF